MFLWPNHKSFDNHQIIPDLWRPSDHVPLTVSIAIKKEHIHMIKQTITKNSKEEKEFIKELEEKISSTNISNISDSNSFKSITQKLATAIEDLWNKHSKCVNITKCSKEWWNENCKRNLVIYRQSGKRCDWKSYRKSVKIAKQLFFDKRIQEIASLNKRPWNLMNWVKKHKLLVTEAIKFNSQLCNNLDNLWYTLHQSYNSAQDRLTNPQLLEEITPNLVAEWPPFSSAEIHKVLNKCNNSSALGPDHLSWRHLKRILYDKDFMTNIVNIANTCINLSYWPTHFKRSLFIIIPKPNKSLYDFPESFQPIVLLNTIGKLIKKVISNRIQVHTISLNFLYPNQLGGIQQCSTIDAGVYLTHIICAS